MPSRSMRHCAAVMLLTLPATAFAANWDTDTTRLLGDPAFLPLQGQIFGQTSYDYSAQTYNETSNFSPVLLHMSPDSWNRSTNNFGNTLSYGITDDISVRASLDWGNVRSSDTYQLTFSPFFRSLFTHIATSKTVNYHAAGAQDPLFSATWRALDQRHAPLNLDITLAYAPDIFTARDAAFSQTGTVARGGQRGEGTIAVSREWRIFTAGLFATIGYTGERDIYEEFFGKTIETGRADYTLALETQTRPLSFLAINAGLESVWTDPYNMRIPTASGYIDNNTQKLGTVIEPYIGLLSPLGTNRIVGEIRYAHDFYTDGETDYRLVRTATHENSGNIYEASLRFLLF